MCFGSPDSKLEFYPAVRLCHMIPLMGCCLAFSVPLSRNERVCSMCVFTAI